MKDGQLTARLDKEFHLLLEVIRANFRADHKDYIQLLYHFFRYYKYFNEVFVQASLEDKRLVHKHFLQHHETLGEDVEQVVDSLPQDKEGEGFHLDRVDSIHPVEVVLRRDLHREIRHVGQNLRKYKRALHMKTHPSHLKKRKKRLPV